jgi:hypothetical protein
MGQNRKVNQEAVAKARNQKTGKDNRQISFNLSISRIVYRGVEHAPLASAFEGRLGSLEVLIEPVLDVQAFEDKLRHAGRQCVARLPLHLFRGRLL